MANGLISTKIEKDDPLKSVVGFEPEKGVVAPEETVQSQIRGLVAQESPFIQEARTRAAQEANRRGLLSSSMAVGEGERAAYAAALPVAAADARTFSERSMANLEAENRARQFTAGVQTQGALQTAAAQHETGLQKMRGEQAENLARIEADFKTLMQSSDSASRFFSQISNSISEIQKEPNISAENKAQLIQMHTNLLRNGLTVIGGIANLDLAGLLNFTGMPAPA